MGKMLGSVKTLKCEKHQEVEKRQQINLYKKERMQ